MSKNKQIVVDETVDTLIDIVWELVTDYMYEYGEYKECQTSEEMTSSMTRFIVTTEKYKN
jgi:hypothetical protein